MNQNKPNAEKIPFFDNPKNISIMLISFYVICGLLVILDFVVHRHIYVSFEEIPAFYAIYGFIACVVLVVIAKEMRKLVMRDENYYQDRDDTELNSQSTEDHSQESK
ncbi:hypothetical protein [Glaciecola sp. 1036]|uniref:hypothetical protein n=1 Tax=Alteromonadaceae TaxID=72275 RepID=UPI003CFF73B4